MVRLFVVLLLTSVWAWGHPTYVRLGYASCTGCHVSPQGGGLLTAYGKGIAMTQSFITTEPEEDEKVSRYVHAIQARVMNYKTETETRNFPMQFDYLAKFNMTDKVWAEGILAVAPKPKDEPKDEKKSTYQRIYARQLGVSWQIASAGYAEDRLSVGINALPMGLGIIDHTAYFRSENRQSVTDVPVVLKYYRAREKHYGHVFAFAPNPNEEVGNKESGYGGQWWWRPFTKIALGVQGLQGQTEAIRRRQGGLVAKAGHGKISWLGEIDRTWRTIESDSSEFRQWTWFQQLSFYPWEHLQLYASLQGLERDREFLNRESREGIGLEWRIWKNVSFLYESRTRISLGNREYSQLAQIYINGW